MLRRPDTSDSGREATVLKNILKKIKELANNVRKSMPPSDSPLYRSYTSVPMWKPWRDY
jgi:hypothetical protein